MHKACTLRVHSPRAEAVVQQQAQRTRAWRPGHAHEHLPSTTDLPRSIARSSALRTYHHRATKGCSTAPATHVARHRCMFLAAQRRPLVRRLAVSRRAAMAQRVQAYLGLPTEDDITTTHTNAIWRDKLGREDRRGALPRHAAPPASPSPTHAPQPACCQPCRLPRRSQGKRRVAHAVGRALRRDEDAVGGRPHPPPPAPADPYAAATATVSGGCPPQPSGGGADRLL